MKTITVAALFLISIAISGCATTSAELSSTKNNMQVWQVEASSERVFRTYKNYIESDMSSNMFGSHVGQEGYFYGPDAELSIRMTGNLLASIVYLHFEMTPHDDGTRVHLWYYNSPWRSNAEEFKTLLPTTVVSAAQSQAASR